MSGGSLRNNQGYDKCFHLFVVLLHFSFYFRIDNMKIFLLFCLLFWSNTLTPREISLCYQGLFLTQQLPSALRLNPLHPLLQLLLSQVHLQLPTSALTSMSTSRNCLRWTTRLHLLLQLQLQVRRMTSVAD